MSTFEPRQIHCSCGEVTTVRVGRGVHASRLPAVRQAILDGSFHRFECGACGLATVLETALIYTDFPRGHYIAVEPPGSSEAAALARHQAVFADNVAASPAASSGLRCRLVFGRAALREKLLAWDRGYDDYLIEALKADIVATTTLSPPLSLESAGPEGLVLCDCAGVRWPIAREVYEALERNRHQIAAAHPGLRDDWLVSASAR